jgi:hypothetical protein
MARLDKTTARRPARRCAFWLRWLAVFALLFGTPATQGLLQDVLSLAEREGCGDGACEDGRGECCPQSCTHCACCVHPTAAPPQAQALPPGPMASEPIVAWLQVGACSTGYGMPPFRPPAA